MKKIKFSLFLFILLISFSVSLSAGGMRNKMKKLGIRTEYDDFTETTKTILNLPVGNLKAMAEISIGFIKIDPLEEDNLRMYSYIYKADWLFVKKIVFKIDGEMFEYFSINDIHETVQGPYIEEYNQYPIDLDFIKKLASGSDIKIRLYGTDFYLDAVYKDYSSLINEYLKIIGE